MKVVEIEYGDTLCKQEAVGVSASDMTGGLCFLLFTSGDPDKITCVQRFDNNNNNSDNSDNNNPEACRFDNNKQQHKFL